MLGVMHRLSSIIPVVGFGIKTLPFLVYACGADWSSTIALGLLRFAYIAAVSRSSAGLVWHCLRLLCWRFFYTRVRTLRLNPILWLRLLLLRRLWIRLDKFKQRAKTLSPEITFNGVGSRLRLIIAFRLLLLGLWRGIRLSWFWRLQRLWAIGYPDQRFRIIFFQIFSSLGVFAWRGRPFLICFMHWDVFIEYI